MKNQKKPLSDAAIHQYATNLYDAGFYSAALQEMAKEIEEHRKFNQHYDDSKLAEVLISIAEQLAFVASFPSADGNARETLQKARHTLARLIRELKQ